MCVSVFKLMFCDTKHALNMSITYGVYIVILSAKLSIWPFVFNSTSVRPTYLGRVVLIVLSFLRWCFLHLHEQCNVILKYICTTTLHTCVVLIGIFIAIECFLSNVSFVASLDLFHLVRTYNHSLTIVSESFLVLVLCALSVANAVWLFLQVRSLWTRHLLVLIQVLHAVPSFLLLTQSLFQGMLSLPLPFGLPLLPLPFLLPLPHPHPLSLPLPSLSTLCIHCKNIGCFTSSVVELQPEYRLYTMATKCMLKSTWVTNLELWATWLLKTTTYKWFEDTWQLSNVCSSSVFLSLTKSLVAVEHSTCITMKCKSCCGLHCMFSNMY